MKIIIFGSNGMLGTYLNKVLEKNYHLIPITRKDIDLAKASESEIIKFTTNLVSEKDLIINASGIIKQRAYDINDMINVNSIFPNILAKIKENIKCNIIHITTDCVYSGTKGSYFETDFHDCTDEYGKTKSLGENKNLTIIRTSIIGEELVNKKSLLEWVKSQKNSEINGFTNHLWNGVTCLELSNLIQNMIANNNFWENTKHIFSPKTVSKFELINIINEIYELNIIINKKQTDEKCFRNLNSMFKNPIIKDLNQQIKELKNFKIN